MGESATDGRGTLTAAGLPADEVARWAAADPAFPATDAATIDTLARDAAAAARYYALPEALERLAAFQQDGTADLSGAVVERRGKAGYVSVRNPRFLNAEDDATLGPTEVAIDLVLLDPAIEVGVLRGAPVEHPRYRGR